MPEDGSDDGGTGGTGDDGTNGAAALGATGAGNGAAGDSASSLGGNQGPAAGGDAQDVSALPEWAQKLIKDTRGEAASNRTAKTQAEKDKADMLSKIGQALGLTKDEKPDPEKLAADLASRDSALRDTQIQLAVLKNAPGAKGDPDALLDSNSFMKALAELDPAAGDFNSKITAAITAAVKANPKLGVGAPVGSGGREIGGQGGSNNGNTDGDGTSDAEIDKMVRANRNRK
jgi:hypothetical protein